MAGAQIQEARGADIGKQADPGLRHRQQRLLGRDPVGAVDRNPGAAAHRDAVDDREIRFRIAMDAADQLVFFPEEHRGQVTVAGNAAPGLVDRADVAAGAERPLAGAAHQHGADAGSSSQARSIGSKRRYMPSVKALSARGRFSVTVATPPSRPNRMSSEPGELSGGANRIASLHWDFSAARRRYCRRPRSRMTRSCCAPTQDAERPAPRHRP